MISTYLQYNIFITCKPDNIYMIIIIRSTVGMYGGLFPNGLPVATGIFFINNNKKKKKRVSGCRTAVR